MIPMSAHVDVDYMCVYIAEDLESYVLMHYDIKCFFLPQACFGHSRAL